MLTKLCSKCGRVMALGTARCGTCQSKTESRHRRYDKNVRDKQAAKFYASSQWIRARDLTMARAGYQCTRCKKQGKLTPATEVHHVVPIRADWGRRLDIGNLVALCHKCHMAVEKET